MQVTEVFGTHVQAPPAVRGVCMGPSELLDSWGHTQGPAGPSRHPPLHRVLREGRAVPLPSPVFSHTWLPPVPL